MHTCRQGAVVQYKEQSRHTHEHEQGNQYRTTRKPLPRTTTTGQAKKGWLVSNPLRADITTTADTAKAEARQRRSSYTVHTRLRRKLKREKKNE
jgi:hypothetical protein